MMTEYCEIFWEGPGYYAGRQARDSLGAKYCYWYVGAKLNDSSFFDAAQEARRQMLGTPIHVMCFAQAQDEFDEVKEVA